MKTRKALYPGSFDPFTKGHLSVLEKAVDIFDEIYIVISTNPAKQSRFSIQSRLHAIDEATAGKYYKDKITIFESIDSIPARIAQDWDCSYIIRGIRNDMDYNYEEGLAQYNKEFNPNIETVYFRADNSAISSTMVNAFMKEHINVDKYLPYNPKILDKIEWGGGYDD